MGRGVERSKGQWSVKRWVARTRNSAPESNAGPCAGWLVTTAFMQAADNVSKRVSVFGYSIGLAHYISPLSVLPMFWCRLGLASRPVAK